MDVFENIDRYLFLLINQNYHPALDVCMFYISKNNFWIPLYLLLAYLIYKKDRALLLSVLISTALLILASDQLSVLCKNIVQRYRPCHNEELKNIVHLVKGHCGGQFGFVSSHAANTFALAVFIGGKLSRKWTITLIMWSLLVGYSRVYLGAHYPSDIIGGYILGVGLAILIDKFVFKRLLNRNNNFLS